MKKKNLKRLLNIIQGDIKTIYNMLPMEPATIPARCEPQPLTSADLLRMLAKAYTPNINFIKEQNPLEEATTEEILTHIGVSISNRSEVAPLFTFENEDPNHPLSFEQGMIWQLLQSRPKNIKLVINQKNEQDIIKMLRVLGYNYTDNEFNFDNTSVTISAYLREH